MAVYDYVPDIDPVRKPRKKTTSSRQRSQMPGHPTEEPRGMSEATAKNSPKVAKATGGRVSKALDTKNKGSEVAGKGSPRDTLAQGARKASTPSPKPKGTDKKVRGQAKK